MPRDGSGVYSKPAGTTASANTTIESAKYNAFSDDLVSDLNAARPITAGGTGETSARLPDGTWRFKNTADATKLLALDLSPITTGTTRTITMGDADVTLRPTPINGTVATASGTTVAFTGIPSWVKQITITGTGLSMDGDSDYLIQIGDSGGYEDTNYLGGVNSVVGGGTTAFSTAFQLSRGFTASLVTEFTAILTLHNATTNTWGFTCMVSTTTAVMNISLGTKSLSATLDRLRLVNDGSPAKNFDAGTVNIQYS